MEVQNGAILKMDTSMSNNMDTSQFNSNGNGATNGAMEDYTQSNGNESSTQSNLVY